MFSRFEKEKRKEETDPKKVEIIEMNPSLLVREEKKVQDAITTKVVATGLIFTGIFSLCSPSSNQTSDKKQADAKMNANTSTKKNIDGQIKQPDNISVNPKTGEVTVTLPSTDKDKTTSSSKDGTTDNSQKDSTNASSSNQSTKSNNTSDQTTEPSTNRPGTTQEPPVQPPTTKTQPPQVDPNLIPTTELTPDIINRLQRYSYFYGKPQSGFGFNDVHDLYIRALNIREPDFHKWAYDTFAKGYKFHGNVKFYSSYGLTYFSQNGIYVVRGLVQVKLNDGIIEEQDIEYAFNVSANLGEDFALSLIGSNKLGEKRTIKN